MTEILTSHSTHSVYYEGETGGVLYFNSFSEASKFARDLKRSYPACYVEVIEL